MELRAILAELVSSLTHLDFVVSMSIQTEAFTMKGRIYLQANGFVEVYFNERTQTLAVAWIVEEQRKWGIGRDNLRGWHRHPLENPYEHQAIAALSIQDIIRELDEVWRQVHEA